MSASASLPRPAAARASDRARITSKRKPIVADVQERLAAGQRILDATHHREDHHPVRGDGLHRVGFGEGVGALVEHGERPVGIGQSVEPVGRAATHDAHAVGFVELGQVDPGQHPLEQVGLVAAEVELAQQLAGAGPDACRHRPLDEALGGGVVAVEEGEACRVEHELGVDLTAAVEPPGDEPHPVVTSAGADRFDAVGQLATQAAGARATAAGGGGPRRRAGGRATRLTAGPTRGPSAGRGARGLRGRRGPTTPASASRAISQATASSSAAWWWASSRPRRRSATRSSNDGVGLDRPDEVPHAVVLGQGAGVPGGLDELAEHAGVAHGQVAEPSQRPGHQRPAEGPVEDRLDALLGSGSTVEPAQVPVLDEVVERRGPAARAHGEDGEHGARLHEGRHQRPRQVVELVAVVDQQQQALVAGLGSERRPGPVEHPGAVELVGAAG